MQPDMALMYVGLMFPNMGLLAGLSKRTTSEGLREAFAEFGEVLHGMVLSFLCCSFHAMDLKLLISLTTAARVVTDRVSGFSKGFGFVRYATTEEAAKGIEGKDGKVWLLYIFFVLN
jgi:RNA recognition motif-containing protein